MDGNGIQDNGSCDMHWHISKDMQLFLMTIGEMQRYQVRYMGYRGNPMVHPQL